MPAGGQKVAALYLWRGRFLVARIDTTDAWLPLQVDDTVDLPASVTDGELGSAIRLIALRARNEIPHPNPDAQQAEFERFLARIGARSWATFMRNTPSADVWLLEGRFLLMPLKNDGPRLGWSGGGDLIDVGDDTDRLGSEARALLMA